MTENADRIGVVRQHRWMSADKQAELLRPRCRKVVSLGGGKLQQVELADLERLSRPGTVVELVHAFLLVDAERKRSAPNLQKDLRAVLCKLKARGASVVDVSGHVCSGKQRTALLALADKNIASSKKGAKSAANGTKSKGRPEADFTPEQYKEAKAIWRDDVEYPEWKDAKAALAKIVSPNGQKFTADRAHKKWPGGRT